MHAHDYVEPDGSFWRGLCPRCAKPREHPIHALVDQAAVELAGAPIRMEPARPRQRTA